MGFVLTRVIINGRVKLIGGANLFGCTVHRTHMHTCNREVEQHAAEKKQLQVNVIMIGSEEEWVGGEGVCV